MRLWDWLKKVFNRKRPPKASPAPEVLIVAQDIQITWVNPTLDTANKPTTIVKVRIWEIQPGVASPVLAKEIVDLPTISAQSYVLVGYYTIARPYTFEVSFLNADGESALSPPGTDSVDVPQASGAPGVKIFPKP